MLNIKSFITAGNNPQVFFFECLTIFLYFRFDNRYHDNTKKENRLYIIYTDVRQKFTVQNFKNKEQKEKENN